MKVILLRDIAKIGKKYDVKDMPNGYAAHLLRTGTVEMATPGKLAQLESKKSADKDKELKAGDELDKAINKIDKEGVRVEVKANDKGHLFEGITAVKIQEVIAESIVELPISSIVLPEPIKEVGEYELELINGDKTTKVKLTIAPQE
jgi:large subunit ribosomal protein L9